MTVGGRYNHATIKLEDNTGDFPDLNATNKYRALQSDGRRQLQAAAGLSVYGGYSESNRAPTPAELGCAEPENPCLIESFLTDDPPLEQVVGRTAEVGLRGQGLYYGGRYTWSAGLFRTLASDDILPITDADGRIFFVNAGDTLRQGVELSATYETRKWNVYASYAFVDATLDTCDRSERRMRLPRQAGDRLPGIPRHRFKAGVEYWVTSKWKVGADLVAASNQPFFPNEVSDEADDGDASSARRLHARGPAHVLRRHRQRSRSMASSRTCSTQRYGLYGTYFEADEVARPDGLDDGLRAIRARSRRRCRSRPTAASRCATKS